MKKIKTIMLTLTLLCGLGAPLALSGDSFALFEGSKKAACNGASLATNSGDCETGAAYSTAATRLENTIERIINIVTIIVGIIAVILIIINGLRMITSNGDSNNITAARNGIIYALVGLVIVALAQFIVRFVVSKT